MKKVLLDLTKIQQGFKIQLVHGVREKLGEDRTKPGKRIAFFEEDGKIVLEALD